MKKIFSFAAIAAVALTTGCAQNEVSERNLGHPDNISLDATPTRGGTRAAVVGLNDLQGTNGFKVFGAVNGATNWYVDGSGKKIDGENDHKFTGGKWNFTDPVKWPATGYPMTFSAYYAKEYLNLKFASKTPQNLRGELTVPTNVAEQVDFLTARATANNKPPSSNMTITFKHALSKINYAAKTPEGYSAYVMKVGVENVANIGIYNFNSDQWADTALDLEAIATVDYNYFGAFGSEKAIIGNNVQMRPFHTPADAVNANLMLIPQDIANHKWNYPTVKTPGTKTFVYSFYRVEKTAGSPDKNYLGFEHASSHPDYNTSTLKGKSYDGPLYVYAGYSYTLNWAPGKGYTYNLAMPGGVYISGKYIDKDGNETDLEIGGVDPGDPIDDKDGFIHLIPDVEPWIEVPGQNLD